MGSSDWRQAKKKGTIPWDRDSPRVRGGQIDHVGGGREGEGGWKNNFCDFFFLVNLWQNILSLVGHSPQPPIELLSGDELQHNRFL